MNYTHVCLVRSVMLWKQDVVMWQAWDDYFLVDLKMFQCCVCGPNRSGRYSQVHDAFALRWVDFRLSVARIFQSKVS